MSSYAAWLILGMAAITWAFRLGGYLMGGLLPRTGCLAYVLDRLPAFVLISLVAPTVWNLGWIGAIASALVVLVTCTTGSTLLAMISGTSVLALARHLNLAAF